MRIEFDQKVTLLALTLLVGLFGGLCWWPRQLERSALADQIARDQAQIAADRKRAGALPELRQRLADLKREAAAANRIVPPTHELADLLHRLTSQLSRQDMFEQEIQTEAVVEGADFNVIPLTLRFSGTYDGLFAFVRAIETMPRLTRVNMLEITGVPTKPTEPVLVRLDLTTFSQPGESQR